MKEGRIYCDPSIYPYAGGEVPETTQRVRTPAAERTLTAGVREALKRAVTGRERNIVMEKALKGRR